MATPRNTPLPSPGYVSRITRMTVFPYGQPLYSEKATEVAIVDEAAGEYVEVWQPHMTENGRIAIDPAEWPAVRDAIDQMVGLCRRED